jgi:hypothetical protein
MDQNYTHITVVIDRSGSMSSLAKDTIGGFNHFLEEQQKLPGKATMTLVQFDHEYQVDFNGVPLANVPKLNDLTYSPRGGTALLDGLHKAIQETKEYVNSMPEDSRPGRIVAVVITDGEENSSREIKKDDLKKLVEECQTAMWRFVFMGANIDSFSEAGSVGIGGISGYAGSTLNYDATSKGISETYTLLSRSMSSVRSMNCAQALDRNTEFFTDSNTGGDSNA